MFIDTFFRVLLVGSSDGGNITYTKYLLWLCASTRSGHREIIQFFTPPSPKCPLSSKHGLIVDSLFVSIEWSIYMPNLCDVIPLNLNWVLCLFIERRTLWKGVFFFSRREIYQQFSIHVREKMYVMVYVLASRDIYFAPGCITRRVHGVTTFSLEAAEVQIIQAWEVRCTVHPCRHLRTTSFGTLSVRKKNFAMLM